jgi:hypothetical protein
MTNKMIKASKLVICALLLFLYASPSLFAFDMGLSPAKVEETLLPGTEKTVVYAVTNCSSTSNLRIQVLVYDWKVSTRGGLMTPKPGTYEYSASSWVEASPSEFVIKPRQTQLVRATYKVPTTAKPGDYLTSLLFRQRIIVPPVKERSMGQLVPQGLMGSLTYINVPPAEKKPSLESMRYVAPDGRNPARIEIAIKNDGNTHVRPKGNLQVKDSAGQTVYMKDLNDLSVVLRDSIGIRDFPIDAPLPPGKYEAIVNTDLDVSLGRVERGRLSFDYVQPKTIATTKSKEEEPASKAQGAAPKPGQKTTQGKVVAPQKPAPANQPSPKTEKAKAPAQPADKASKEKTPTQSKPADKAPPTVPAAKPSADKGKQPD